MLRVAVARQHAAFLRVPRPLKGHVVNLRVFSTVDVPDPPTSNHLHVPFPDAKGTIVYTETDEAPALATYALYPVISKFSYLSDIDIVPCDISLAGRILAAFPEKLKTEQRIPDNLKYLGDLTKDPECSIVKLPNVSATITQVISAIEELRSNAKGYDVPIYPYEPKTEEEKEIQARYMAVSGSAVNPVLRMGNSDRRVAAPVKAYAQKNPHTLGMWSKASRTHVAHMESGDFYESEQSKVIPEATSVSIVLETPSGSKVLKESVKLDDGEVIDASYMNIKALQDFYEAEIEDAKENDILLSLHLKATMMRVSDPVFFGHCVRVFFKDAFAKHGETLARIGASPNSGLASMYSTIDAKLSKSDAEKVKADFEACYEDRPWLAMVNSNKGITNLHAANDIIIDASMPVVVRDSGKMWNKMGESEDVKCMIPDRCYATMYQEVISYVKTKGQFDVATMGSVVSSRFLNIGTSGID